MSEKVRFVILLILLIASVVLLFVVNATSSNPLMQ